MKKLTYSLGFLFTLILVAGATFKFVHWPYADLLMLTGVTGNAIVFVPLVQFVQQKVKIVAAFKWIFASIGFAMLFWFELMQWPGAGEVVILGAIIFAFGFLPYFFIRLYKQSLMNQGAS